MHAFVVASRFVSQHGALLSSYSASANTQPWNHHFACKSSAGFALKENFKIFVTKNKMMKLTGSIQRIFKGSRCDSLSCPLKHRGEFRAGGELTREAQGSSLLRAWPQGLGQKPWSCAGRNVLVPRKRRTVT